MLFCAGIVEGTSPLRHDPAISAVAVSQYGAVATLAAVAFLGERLARRQALAVAVLAVGAAVVAGAD